MPYTPAHAAAVLPLKNLSRFPLAVAMLSSLAPDLGYYLFLPHSFNVWAHSFLGSFLLATFFSFAAARFIYFFRNEMSLFFGVSFSRKKFSPLFYLMACALGAWSHVVWDSFTHELGWSVQRFTFLQTHIAFVPLYKGLQYLSSLVGLILIMKFLKIKTLFFQRERTQSLLMLLSIFLITIAQLFMNSFQTNAIKEKRELGVTLVLALSRAFLLVFFSYCGWLKRTTRLQSS